MLKGEKVSLRAVERDDLKTIFELKKNLELTLLADGAWQPEPLEHWQKHFDKHMDEREYNDFVIEVDGKLIGEIGLHHSHRRDGSTQFGVAIFDPDYLGKGYGADAIETLLRWAFQVQNWRRVWLQTLSVNERALRTYRRLGFVEEGRLREQAFFDGRYVDVIEMGMLRGEWESRRDPRRETRDGGQRS